MALITSEMFAGLREGPKIPSQRPNSIAQGLAGAANILQQQQALEVQQAQQQAAAQQAAAQQAAIQALPEDQRLALQSGQAENVIKLRELQQKADQFGKEIGLKATPQVMQTIAQAAQMVDEGVPVERVKSLLAGNNPELDAVLQNLGEITPDQVKGVVRAGVASRLLDDPATQDIRERQADLREREVQLKERAELRGVEQREEEIAKKEKTERAAKSQVLKTTEKLIKKVEERPDVLGISGSIAANIPGTEAKDFEQALETFRSASFFNNIERLRGMGALTDAEGARAISLTGTLDQSMSPEAFIETAKEIQSIVSQGESRASDSGSPLPVQGDDFSNLWGD